MEVFSYHLVKLSMAASLRMMIFPMRAKAINGLVHAETMSAMILGSPIFSTNRIFSRTIIVFAQWKNEAALDAFLQTSAYGKQLSGGWHVRMIFLRQWGKITGFKIPAAAPVMDDNAAVVAVTIARMKYSQVPRFLRWGRPVEKQVRDHSGTTLSLASIRYPNTVSTFSIWKTQKEMTDMVHGHSKLPASHRHVDAMKERERKDFHFEFTTLRFQPIAEYGCWNQEQHYLPSKK